MAPSYNSNGNEPGFSSDFDDGRTGADTHADISTNNRYHCQQQPAAGRGYGYSPGPAEHNPRPPHVIYAKAPGYSYSAGHYGDDSFLEECAALVSRSCRRLWAFATGPGCRRLSGALLRAAHQMRRNLAARRLLSFPHALVALWVLMLLWGERWVFHSAVERCDWGEWESWVSLFRVPHPGRMPAL